jgi:hypothetical protein
MRLASTLLAAIAPLVATQADAVDFVMKPAGLFADQNAELQIIGGTKADPADWPATFVFKEGGGGGCTSTLIGERAIITAAHCIDNGATGIIEVADEKLEVICRHHPAYRKVTGSEPNWEELTSPDFALCLVADKLPARNFERVDVTGERIRVGEPIRLLGFGCRQKSGSDGAFGVLYEGKATITQIPQLPSYYTRTDGAAVCYGDSGGGAYQYKTTSKYPRLLVAINSRGDISKESLLSTTKLSGFSSWITAWATENSIEICGIHEHAKGCSP